MAESLNVLVTFPNFAYRLCASQFHKGAQFFERAAKFSIVVGLHQGVLHPAVRVVRHRLAVAPLYCKSLLLPLNSGGVKKIKVLSRKSLNPQESEHSGSSHKQLTGPFRGRWCHTAGSGAGILQNKPCPLESRVPSLSWWLRITHRGGDHHACRSEREERKKCH